VFGYPTDLENPLQFKDLGLD